MMRKIFTFNVGSSSCKFQIFNENIELLGKGLIDKIGIRGTNIKYKDSEGKTFTFAKDIVFNELAETLIFFLQENDLINWEDVYLMSHRIVSGGERFNENIIIENEGVLNELIELNHLAPLHNPYNNEMIKAMMDRFPNVTQVACFDTAFHSTIPEYNYLYALPYELYSENNIRKYGAHGSSHAFITEQMEKHFDKKVNIINAHLGNGSSVCVTKESKSINTSMGFTPLAGLVMGTRTGDIDPSIPLYLINQLGMDAKEVDTLLNKKSGLLGVSGVSSDMREILEEVEKGNERAILSRTLTAKRIADVISMYLSEVDHVDAITFTGGIGENDHELIRDVFEKLRVKNISLLDKFEKDKEINLISNEDTDIPVYIVPTNEELYMAVVAKRLIGEL